MAIRTCPLPEGVFTVPAPRATDAAGDTLRHAFGGHAFGNRAYRGGAIADGHAMPLPSEWLALLERIDRAGNA